MYHVAVSGMRLRYPPPENPEDFEVFCLRLLRMLWNCSGLQVYGRRGHRQSGIDLLDTSGPEAKAAQCKHREERITVAEILDEIEKAKSFRPALARYAILTTAKRDPKAQSTVLTINQRHQEEGLFQVELYSWDDILELVNQLPDALVQQFYGESALVAPPHPLQPVLRVEIVGATAADSLDSDIDEAKRLIESHQHETARLFLDKMKARQWGNMGDWHKFRVLSNLAATFFGEGQFHKAAQLYLEAKDFQPNNEQALANEALAYHLLGNSAQAFDLATVLIARFPNAKRPLAIWINAAPESMSREVLEKNVPEHLKDDGEICLALAYRALASDELQTAERLAQKASQTIPEHPPVWLLLGQIQVRREYKRIASSADPFQEVDLALGRQVEQVFTKAIELARGQGSAVLVDAILERAELRHLLGDRAGREEDIQAARSLAPDRASVKKAYAGVLISRRDFTGAIDLLRAVKASEPDARVDPLLAATLRDRNQPGDLAEAAFLFSNVAKCDPHDSPGARRLAAKLALECLQLLRQGADALRLLEELPESLFSGCALAVLRGQLHLSAGDNDAASELASRALQLHKSTESAEETRSLALLLAGLGRHEEACLLWHQLRIPGRWNADSRGLLQCLSRLERHKEALEICREMREAGVEDESLREYELDLLERYDIPQAIRLLQDRISRHPDDRLSRLRLSLIGLRLDRPELASADPDSLPPVEAASARVGRAVVQVLQVGGRPDDALRYAYELLRRHFSDPDAHRAYISVLAPIGPPPNVPRPQEAGIGTAVAYVEEPHSEENWVVIEDSENPDISRNEYPPDHPLAQRLLGKRLGENFVLADATVRNRMATVRQVLSKYVFRFRDCMNQWQLRFPLSSGVESVTVVKRVGEREEYDLSVIEEFAERRQRQREEILSHYRSSILTLHVVGEQFSVSVFDAVAGLAQDSEVEIRTCNGSAQEKAAALAALNSADAAVLDATAIATLWMLENPAVLNSWPTQLVVSQTTMNSLREVIAGFALETAEGGYIAKQGSRLVLTTEPAGRRQERVERLRRFVALLESRCRIEACPAVAALPADQRKVLIGVFGHHGVESILLARSDRRLLWTDDWVVGAFAAGEYAVRRVWTQAALAWAADHGLGPDAFIEASSKLTGWRYVFTGLNVGILVKCGVLASWKPDAWPLKQCLDRLADPAVTSQDTLLLVAGFMVRLCRECFLPELRNAVIVRTLDQLSKRAEAMRLIDAVERALPQLFGLDPLGADQSRKVIQAWRKARCPIVLP